jgi:hypothetical protein
MNRGIEVGFKAFAYLYECRAESAKSPTYKESENADNGECKTPFPCWPVERIIDIV